MTDQATIVDIRDGQEIAPSEPASSADIAAGLEAQARALDGMAEALDAQALALRVQAERLLDKAAMVRRRGVAAVGRVVPSPVSNLEAALRNALLDAPASEVELAKRLGVARPKLRELADALIREGKLIRMPVGRGCRYAWLVPEDGSPQPREAPRQEPRIRADLAPGKRGTPVRVERANGKSRSMESTAGQGHRIRQRRKRREAMTETAKQRQEANKAKAAKDKERHRTHGKGAKA